MSKDVELAVLEAKCEMYSTEVDTLRGKLVEMAAELGEQRARADFLQRQVDKVDDARSIGFAYPPDPPLMDGEWQGSKR